MKTILVVDNDPDALESIEQYLSLSGFRVITMTDGPSALSVVRRGEPVDLVIADYRMQGMDGLELLAHLKQTVPSTPVIIISGQVSIECYLKSLGLGAFEYITKPFGPQELDRVVSAALTDSGHSRTIV